MIEFGYTLRKAREDKGLTIAQVSEITRMLPQQIEDLENENFSRIAAPIYGRGFVKLFCEAVDLEPKPLVEEFMEIYNGNRQPAIRARRAVEPPTPPAAQPAPSCDDTEVTMDSPLAPPPPPPPQPAEMAGSHQAVTAQQEESPAPNGNDDAATTFFSAPQEEESETRQEGDAEEPFKLEGETLPTAFMEMPPAAAAGNLPSAAPTQTQELEDDLGSAVRFAELVNRANAAQPPPKPRGASRYAAPSHIDIDSGRNSGFSVNPTVWRFAALAVVACLVLWGVWSLASKLWNAATNAPQADITDVSGTSTTALPRTPDPRTQAQPAQPSAQGTPAASMGKREPIKIPPLYID